MNSPLSSICISPNYQFTQENCLIECAKLLVSIGINTIKFSLVPKNINITSLSDDIKTLTQLVMNESNYRYVFDMVEMKNYIIWAYTLNGCVVKDGMTEQEKESEYKQIYDLTKYLLTTYNNSGKTFYLGNWESDWGALGVKEYNGEDPDPLRVQSLIDYFNIRQKAVDDAKANTDFKGVNVYHYAEVVMVKDVLNNCKRCLNAVIPFVPNLDLISWSAYTIQDDTPDDIVKLLNLVESYLPKAKSNSINGKRIFIGEFGWKFLDGIAAVYKLANFTKTILTWGCPFALFWQIYSNEKNTTFNLIKPDGNETEKLKFIKLYYQYINNSDAIDKSLLELIPKTNDIQYVCKNNTLLKYSKHNVINTTCSLLLEDYATIDLNGFNQQIVNISNIGIRSEITNSSSNTSLLIITDNCRFGSFNNNVFNGIRNGYGNSTISGNIQLQIMNGTCTTDSKHLYTQGTTIYNGTLITKANECLGYGSLFSYGGTVSIECTTPFINNNSIINLGNYCNQLKFMVSCSLSQTINLDSIQGTTSCGLIDVYNNSNVYLNGPININKLPKNGGHFGSSTNSLLYITGFITSSVPVIWRRNICIISGGGSYNTFRIAQGTIILSASNGISSQATLELGSHGDAIFDMNGYDQNIKNITYINNKCIVTNSGSNVSILVINNDKKIIINPNENFMISDNKIGLVKI